MARLGYRCRHHLVEYGLHCSKQNEHHMLIDRIENIDKENTDLHSVLFCFLPIYQNTWINESADSLATLLVVHGKELIQRT